MRLPILRVLLILLALFNANAFAQEPKRGRGTDAWRIRAKVYEPLIASTANAITPIPIYCGP
jgi:hypothetical protein